MGYSEEDIMCTLGMSTMPLDELKATLNPQDCFGPYGGWEVDEEFLKIRNINIHDNVICETGDTWTLTTPVERMIYLIKKGKSNQATNLFMKELIKPKRKGKKMKTKTNLKSEIEELKKRVSSIAYSKHKMELRSIWDVIEENTERIKKLEHALTPEHEIEELKAEIDKLKYPMGRMFTSDKKSTSIFAYCHPYGAEYRYANKTYPLSKMADKNITGYRKQGDYVQIRWVEEEKTAYTEEVDDSSIVHTQLFLLKDELVPLENCEVKFDCEFVEVE